MAVTSLSADLASGMKRVNETKTALKEILNFAGCVLLTIFIMGIPLFFYERSKGADIDFDVLGVRGTGGSGGSEYEVTLKNSSSKRLTVYTYLRTGDGF